MRREYEPKSERERRESRLKPKGFSQYADEWGKTISQTIVHTRKEHYSNGITAETYRRD